MGTLRSHIEDAGQLILHAYHAPKQWHHQCPCGVHDLMFVPKSHMYPHTDVCLEPQNPNARMTPISGKL